MGHVAPGWATLGSLLPLLSHIMSQMFRTNLRNTLLMFMGTLPLSGEVIGDVSFRKHIAPILLNRCLACHNQRTSEGGYSITSFQALLKPGDSEERPVVVNNPLSLEDSELLRRLVTEDVGERMPLETDPLPKEEIDLVRRWIREGAKYDGADPAAPLSSILPIAKHPTPPETYAHPLPITAVAVTSDNASATTTAASVAASRRLFFGGYHELFQVQWNKHATMSRRIEQTGERIYDIGLPSVGRDTGDRVYVVSGTPGRLGELRVFDLEGNLLGVPLATAEAMFALAMPSSGSQNTQIAVGGGNRSIYLINPQTNSVEKEYRSHSDWVRALCWSDDGTRLASASRDKTVKLFDPSVDQPIDTYSGHGADVVDVCFVPNKSDQLVSCDAEGGVHFWRVGNAKPVKANLKATHAFALAKVADGVWVSSGFLRRTTATYQVTKFDWSGKKILESHELPARGVSIATADRPDVVCVGLADGRLWRSDANGELIVEVLPRLTE